MLIDPKKIKFETSDDVVDYVTRGFLPPLEKNFELVMKRTSNLNIGGEPGKDVIILDSVFNRNDLGGYEDIMMARKITENVLRRVHKNRVRNRNRFLVAGGIVASLFLARKLMKKKK